MKKNSDMNSEIPVLIPIKKAFGKQHYLIKDAIHREKILNHPLVNTLYSIGKSFAVIANTSNWKIEAVTGESKDLTGYTTEEIYNMGGEFVMNYTVPEHLQVNMATVKTCMEYSNSIPEEQRESVFANTSNWKIEAVTGESKDLTGYTTEEIYNMGGEFVMNYTVQEHLQVNMATVKTCMEYSNSIPEEQRESVFAIYYYHGRKKNGDIVAVQHQSIPLVFDEQKIPFIFCNIYSDISYLDPQNIPHGVMVNKFTGEVFHLNKNSLNLEKREDLFSKREKEIIRLMTNGLTSKEIAEKLFISNDTVRTHRKNILRKAGVSNTISLIKYAIINSIL